MNKIVKRVITSVSIAAGAAVLLIVGVILIAILMWPKDPLHYQLRGTVWLDRPPAGEGFYKDSIPCGDLFMRDRFLNQPKGYRVDANTVAGSLFFARWYRHDTIHGHDYYGWYYSSFNVPFKVHIDDTPKWILDSLFVFDGVTRGTWEKGINLSKESISGDTTLNLDFTRGEAWFPTKRDSLPASPFSLNQRNRK